MKLGALLVIIGLVFVAVDLALNHIPNPRVVTGLLHIGVLLIGIGVLCGSTQINSGT